MYNSSAERTGEDMDAETKAKTEELRRIINNSDNIVFFGGAGVSTASNIPDFRSANGLYSKKSGLRSAPEEILSHTFFMNHTKDFFDFYRDKMIYTEAKPNDAHLALAKLEQAVMKYIIKERTPYIVLGHGSNILVSDKGIREVVLKVEDNLNNIQVIGEKIVAEAGALLTDVSFQAQKHGLSGFEFACGIPGTIGAKERASEGFLSYTRDDTYAVEGVDQGDFQLSFFMNPPQVKEVTAIAEAGEKMPQKSTFFYPKVIAGLVVNKLG